MTRPASESADASIEPLSSLNDTAAASQNVMDLLNSYVHVFLAAFLITLLITPVIRRVAIAFDIIDHPDDDRKAHPYPVAYLGGVAVFFGVLIGIGASYLYLDAGVANFRPVPIAIVIGMVAIAFTGLADDVWGWDPRLKIMGQLVAAAALAIEEVGVRVAAGVLTPVFGAEGLLIDIPTPIGVIEIDGVYWIGTALIAMFVLGGCNAANLIDGLDGLLSGVVAIVATGLLIVCLMMVPGHESLSVAEAQDSLLGARIVLALALLGAVLGFLPHNFNPATIFLGDCGSLLLGYISVVIILMLGDMGQTHLVFAGLIIFALPIIDTTLAIIRRWLAGIPMSAGDDQHIHHQLKRLTGGVRSAVLTLYGISGMFAVVGVTLAALVLHTGMRVRFIYVIAIVLFGCIGVIAVKAARRQQIMLAVQRKLEAGAEKSRSEGSGEDQRASARTAPGGGASPSGATTLAPNRGQTG